MATSSPSWHQSPDHVPEFVDTPISPLAAGNSTDFESLLASLVDGTIPSSLSSSSLLKGEHLQGCFNNFPQGMLVDFAFPHPPPSSSDDWLTATFPDNIHDLLNDTNNNNTNNKNKKHTACSSSSPSSPTSSSSSSSASSPVLASSQEMKKKNNNNNKSSVAVTDSRTVPHDFPSSFSSSSSPLEGFNDDGEASFLHSITTNPVVAAAAAVAVGAGSKRTLNGSAASSSSSSPLAPAAATTAPRGKPASMALLSAPTSTSVAISASGRPTRKAAARAVAALEAAMSPNSSLNDNDNEEGGEYFEDEDDNDNDDDEMDDDNDDISKSAKSRRRSVNHKTSNSNNKAGTRRSTTTAAGAGAGAGAATSGRESCGGANDPNRNARLAKENRERKKRYIAGLEGTIEQLHADVAQREKQQAALVAKHAEEKAALLAQMEILRAQNATLQASLANQTAFAPIIAALQQVPGLSFSEPENISATSHSKRACLAAPSHTTTTTVVPLTFNVHLTTTAAN